MYTHVHVLDSNIKYMSGKYQFNTCITYILYMYCTVYKIYMYIYAICTGYRVIKLRNANWEVVDGATLLVEVRVHDWVGPTPKSKVCETIIGTRLFIYYMCVCL